MSIERRLRQGLEVNGSMLVPEVDQFLVQVRRQTRRRVVVHRATVAAATLAVLFAAIVIGPDLLHAIRSPEGQPATRPTPPSPVQALTGSYQTTLEPGSELIDANGMAGSWTIELIADGRMVVRAPEDYGGVLSGALFEGTRSRFRTNLFQTDLCSGSDVGSYRWTRSGTSLSFTPVDDTCPARVAFFANGSWEALP